MIKHPLLFGLSLLLTGSVSAQIFQEWFNQKQTQIRYLMEQIVAVGTYAGSVKKGYEVARSGLQNIKSLKQRDFNLHSNHFNTLSEVSPSVRKYGKVSEIISMQKGILKVKYLSQKTTNNDLLTTEESSHVNQVFQRLLSESMQDTDQLMLCLSNGNLEMNDAERIGRIDKLHHQIKEKYVFSQSFLNGIKILLLQRSREHQETKDLRRIYGLKTK